MKAIFAPVFPGCQLSFLPYLTILYGGDVPPYNLLPLTGWWGSTDLHRRKHYAYPRFAVRLGSETAQLQKEKREQRCEDLNLMDALLPAPRHRHVAQLEFHQGIPNGTSRFYGHDLWRRSLYGSKREWCRCSGVAPDGLRSAGEKLPMPLRSSAYIPNPSGTQTASDFYGQSDSKEHRYVNRPTKKPNRDFSVRLFHIYTILFYFGTMWDIMGQILIIFQ